MYNQDIFFCSVYRALSDHRGQFPNTRRQCSVKPNTCIAQDPENNKGQVGERFTTRCSSRAVNKSTRNNFFFILLNNPNQIKSHCHQLTDSAINVDAEPLLSCGGETNALWKMFHRLLILAWSKAGVSNLWGVNITSPKGGGVKTGWDHKMKILQKVHVCSSSLCKLQKCSKALNFSKAGCPVVIINSLFIH